MMTYNPKLKVAILTNQLEAEWNLYQDINHYITDAMMISKRIALLNNMGIFSYDIK